MNAMLRTIFLTLCAFLLLHDSSGFTPSRSLSRSYCRESLKATTMSAAADTSADPMEIVARRIVVKGDVQGGYYRSCVLNEAKRFRRLVGNMSPPDDSDRAEIYVEGKRKMIDGFVRWCKKSNVGLSQVIQVEAVLEEQPTGLYDDFYIKLR